MPKPGTSSLNVKDETYVRFHAFQRPKESQDSAVRRLLDLAALAQKHGLTNEAGATSLEGVKPGANAAG